MKKSFIFLLLVLTSYSSWSKTSLLELLKNNKNLYALNSNCKTFIQSATAKTFDLPELKKLAKKASDLPYMDSTYYHYTNASALTKLLRTDISDRQAAQKQILKDGGYTSILEYQMTYSDALTNIAGVGFYLASNPFSSSSYGAYQLAMKLSPKASVLVLEEVSAEYNAAISTFTKNNPLYATCNALLGLSILLSENDIDIFLYDKGREWVSIFNEDIITESKVTYINSTSHLTIGQSIVKQGELENMFEYIKDLNPKGSYAYWTLDTLFGMIGEAGAKDKSILNLASKISTWTPGLKSGFATAIAKQSGQGLQNLMSSFQSKKYLAESDFLSIPLEGASDDFLTFVANKIEKDESIIKSWGKSYNAKMLPLLKKNLIDVGLYIDHLPKEELKGFIGSFDSLGLKPQQQVGVLDKILKEESAFFKSLDANSQYGVFNTYLKHATQDQIPGFIATLENLKYDSKNSFDYISRRPSAFGKNSSMYLMSYIKIKKDPALLTPQVMSVITYEVGQNETNFYIELLKNKATFGAKVTEFSNFIFAKVTNIDLFLRPEFQKVLPREEQMILLGKLLAQPTGADLVKKFQGIYSFSAADFAETLTKNAKTLTDAPAKVVVSYIQSDKAYLPTFLDTTKPDGVKVVLSNANLKETIKQLIHTEGIQFYRSQVAAPASYPVIDALLSSPKRDDYIQQMTADEQYSMSFYIKKHLPRSYTGLVAQIKYDQRLAQTQFKSLLSGATPTKEELEVFLNNKSFIEGISILDLKRLAAISVEMRSELVIDDLLRSDLMTFERSATLLFALGNSNKKNLSFIYENYLNNLSDDEKKNLQSSFIEQFSTMSETARSLAWKDVFNTSKDLGKVQVLVKLQSDLKPKQKGDLAEYYLETKARYAEGMKVFKSENLIFTVEVLRLDEQPLTGRILQYIEASYPAQEAYAKELITLRKDLENTESVLAPHFEKFICKKVNGHHAFAEVISGIDQTEEKKRFKEYRKSMCNWNGWF